MGGKGKGCHGGGEDWMKAVWVMNAGYDWQGVPLPFSPWKGLGF